jgi:tRNA(Arg) A34 adenosine deaminase TadA
MLKLAGEISKPTIEDDPRNFWVGCVGVRDDGAIVSAKNGAVFSTDVDNYQLLPDSHAEGRVLRKLGKGGIIYVARISKSAGGYAMARPCGMCQIRIKSFDVKKVYYSINDTHYGIWFPEDDEDKVFKL